jgi:surface protein
MFSLCTNLKYLDLSSFDIPKGDKMSNMLDKCNALEILITPKTIPGDQYLPYSLIMYDRNGKKYGKLSAKSGSIVLGRTKKLAESFFIDVRDSSNSYYKAVNWAVEKGIANGYSDGTFGINRLCTRGEMIMLLWRFAGKPAPKSVQKSPFVDVPKSHTFYRAILWAYQKDIAKGYSDGKFGVNKSVSRGESMMFLWRLKGKKNPTTVSVSPFKDVPKKHTFYKAILWGYQKHITTGYTSGEKKGSFGINENCTRGQIVTFLYRTR